MQWFEYLSLAAFLFCLLACLSKFITLVRYGPPADFSRKRGNIAKAVKYSYTGAMSPVKKETAYLHLPTYLGGLLYHTGTFLALINYFFQIAGYEYPVIADYIISLILLASAASGTAILIKRIAVSKLRHLSCADDYISNMLVSLFQYLTVSLLILRMNPVYYYISATLLYIYIPAGKLRHLIYFFAARYQLGYFYGWRGVWPPSKKY